MSTDRDTSADKNAESAETAGFSAAERAAMREHAAELRTAAKRAKQADKAAAEARDVAEKIAEMPEADREIAMRVHDLVLAASPGLAPRLWYGMPAYVKNGKVVCFFQAGSKFGSRYCTLGFQDAATLDAGQMWPTSFALIAVGAAESEKITDLVRAATA